MKYWSTTLVIAASLCCFVPSSHAEDKSAGKNAEQQDPDFLYFEAERAFVRNDMRIAVEKINSYFKAHPQGTSAKLFVKALNLRGLIYFQLKNLPAAIEEFGRASQAASTSLPSSDPVLHLTRYNLANALFSSSQINVAAEIMLAIEPAALDADTRARFFHLLGNISLLQEQAVTAVMAFVQSANLAKTPESAESFIQKASAASKRLYSKDPRQDLAKLQDLSGQLDHSLPGTLALQVWIARGQMYSGKTDSAEETLKKFLDKAPANHSLREQASDLLLRIATLAQVEPDKVGILLPLSGKFAKFGRLCMNAIFFAGGIFEDMPSAGEKKIQFVVRDSGDSPESATDAFEKLVMEEKVIAVIGPLLSKQAGAVSQKAQEYGVPILSLSQKRETEFSSPFVFPIALSPEQQIETILNHSMGKRSLKRFAIMAPADNFGDEYVKLFWDGVEKRGGEIVGIERYAPKSTDFRDELQRLLGLEYEQARGLELEELKKRETAFAATLKVKGMLRKRLLRQFELKAVPMFEAVFIPDDPQVVGQLVPAFAVKDVDNIPYLGINSWNTPEIVQRAGRYLQQSLFVDSFFPYSQNPTIAKFTADFTGHLQTLPGTLEVQAYDAAGIILRALNSKDLASRSSLRDQLINLGTYKGISGNFSFSETGVNRSAYLLTVKGSSIAEVDAK